MSVHVDDLEDLVFILRAEGLDAQVDRGDQSITAGTTRRGDRSSPARIELGEDLLRDFLEELGSRYPDDEYRPENARGMLSVLLIESLTAVHDGESNFVTDIRLQRDTNGHVGLSETKSEEGTWPALEGGPYEWVATRPEG